MTERGEPEKIHDIDAEYLAGQRFFQKGDPHAASDHPIAPAAHERSQVTIAIALTAECIERLYRLRQNCPIGLYGASDSERIVAKRGVNVALGFIACVGKCQQGDEQPSSDEFHVGEFERW